MANTFATQVIQDGPISVTIKFTINGDGSGDETDKVIFDASAYSPATTDVSLMEIEYALNGFDATLNWDATTNVHLIDLVSDVAEKHDFHREGGLVNNAGTGKTGDILMTTSGLGAIPNATGFILMHIKKRSIA